MTDTKPSPTSAESLLAKLLAPEDVRTGDYVTVLHVTYEIPSFWWCTDAALLPPEEPVRVRFLPNDGGVPLKVESVCLPFVLVKHPLGQRCTLDLRRSSIARLSDSYAKRAWKSLKKKTKSQSQRSACTL